MIQLFPIEDIHENSSNHFLVADCDVASKVSCFSNNSMLNKSMFNISI